MSFGELVQISRLPGLVPLVGRILARSEQCLLATVISDIQELDGFCLLPAATVLGVAPEFERRDFYQQVLHAAPAELKHGDLLNMLSCTLRDDLQLLRLLGEVVAIHAELTRPGLAFIGCLAEVNEASLVLRRLANSDVDVEELLPIALPDLTRVEFRSRDLATVAYAARLLNLHPPF